MDFLKKCCAQLETSEMEALLKRFGGKLPKDLKMEQEIRWLSQFSERWDFRAKQKATVDGKTGERARWLIDSKGLSKEQEQATFDVAKGLGMMDVDKPIKKIYDTVFILGGARMSCLYRTRYVKSLLDKQEIIVGNIVGLTAMRPVLDSERNATDTYAPNAITEYDLMCRAVESIFSRAPKKIIENKKIETMNSNWAIVEYKGFPAIKVLAAPSSEPDKRRANTADTYVFWKNKIHTQEIKNLLLVTSQIYAPYQQIEAVRMLGIKYGYNIETIGFPREWTGNMQGLQTAANYLQEIRAILQSLEKLL